MFSPFILAFLILNLNFRFLNVDFDFFFLNIYKRVFADGC